MAGLAAGRALHWGFKVTSRRRAEIEDPWLFGKSEEAKYRRVKETLDPDQIQAAQDRQKGVHLNLSPCAVVKRLLKEPLLHFLLGGASLFGLYVWTNDSAENRHTSAAEQIRLSSADVNWLAQNWSAQWGRAPTQPELRELAADYISEQLLEREARVLGLDNNDVIVRRRLAQKMTFLIEDTFRHVDPSESELQRFYATHAEKFRSEARISFKHIYFSPERRADARSEAADALWLLLQEGTTQPPELGDPLLVQADFDDETEQALSGIFGSDFAHEVFTLKPDLWSGPIQSGFGLHLVRVSKLQDAELPPLSAVRARVVEEWRSEQQRAAKQRYLAELSSRYGIDIDEAIKPLGSTATSASVVRGQ